MVGRWLVLFAVVLAACAPAGDKRVSLKVIKENCREYAGKVLEVKVKYLGWRCPESCGAPPLTRSDACVSDGTTCLYLRGTGGLNPLRDCGKNVTLKVRVKQNPKGGCYLEVLPEE